ncbi:MAG: hypothetical protein ACK58T_31320, partial [Phycisphaerae bacterium]
MGGEITTYQYDNAGQLTRVTLPDASFLQYTYDAAQRLTQIADNLGNRIVYTLDLMGNRTQEQVFDPANTLAQTRSRVYNSLNRLTQEIGAAGNIATSTDAKGQVTSYTYDVLNRVTSITYQGGVVHSYAYDQGSNGKGRLTQITEPNSITVYAYDVRGRLIAETRTINGVAYVTAYAYDSAGRLTGMTYPGGRTVNYTLDALGRVQSVATTKDSTSQTVVSSVTYRPFGPSAGHTFGNGQTYTRGCDTDGRITSSTLATQ